MMEGYRREAVWDPVTRLWHWLLAASVITGWTLGEFRTFSIMQWHIYLGYLTGTLLLFRYVWGWTGPTPIRHRTLFVSLREMPAYLRQVGRRRPSGVPGHNPIGALSVIAMVLALTAQVVTGLFSEDDALFYSGPLASEVSSDIVGTMTSYHNLFARVVLVLVALHVAAIFFYLVWKRENLVAPMLNGRKWVRDRTVNGE
jgi:cytochrome b